MEFLKVELVHYLILSAIIFFIGIIGVVISKNLIRVLISIEIMMSAINLNFIAFASFSDKTLQGDVFMLFITSVSALQVALALTLIILEFKDKQEVSSKELEELKG